MRPLTPLCKGTAGPETTDRRYLEKVLFVRKHRRDSLAHKYETRKCPELALDAEEEPGI